MPLIFSIYKLKLGGIIPTTNLFSKFLEKNVEHSVETLNYPVLEVPYYNYRSFSFPFNNALESASNFSLSQAIPFWFDKYQAKNNDRFDNVQEGEFSSLRKPVAFWMYKYPASEVSIKIKNEDGTFKSQALWSEAYKFYTEYNYGVDFLFDNSSSDGVEGRRSNSPLFFVETGYGSTPVYDDSRVGQSFLSSLRKEASFYTFKNNAENYQETQKGFFADNVKFDVKAAANPTLGLDYDSGSISTIKGIPVIVESFNYSQADSFFVEFGYGDEPVKFVIEEGYKTGERGYVFFFHYNDGIEPLSDSFSKVTESVKSNSHQAIPYYGYSYEGSYNTKLDYYDISSFSYSLAQSFYYYKNPSYQFNHFENTHDGVYIKLRKIDQFWHYTYSSTGYNSYLIADNVAGKAGYYSIFYESYYQGYNVENYSTGEGIITSFNIHVPHTVLVEASNNMPGFLNATISGMSQTYFFTPYLDNQYYSKNIAGNIYGYAFAEDSSNSLPAFNATVYYLNLSSNIKVDAVEDQTPIFNEDGLIKSKARSLGLLAYNTKIGQHVQIIPKAAIPQNTFYSASLQQQPYYDVYYIGGYDLAMYASTEQSVEYGNFSLLKEAINNYQGTEHPSSEKNLSQDFEIDYSLGMRVILEWYDFDSIVALSKNYDISFNNALQELTVQSSVQLPQYIINSNEGKNFENLTFQLYDQELEFSDRLNWSNLYTSYLGQGFYQEPFISTHSPASFSQDLELLKPYTYTNKGFSFSFIDEYGDGYASIKSLSTHGMYNNRKYQSFNLSVFNISVEGCVRKDYVEVQNYTTYKNSGGQRVFTGETTFLI